VQPRRPLLLRLRDPARDRSVAQARSIGICHYILGTAVVLTALRTFRSAGPAGPAPGGLYGISRYASRLLVDKAEAGAHREAIPQEIAYRLPHTYSVLMKQGSS
jgi:hypothetical protein